MFEVTSYYSFDGTKFSNKEECDKYDYNYMYNKFEEINGYSIDYLKLFESIRVIYNVCYMTNAALCNDSCGTVAKIISTYLPKITLTNKLGNVIVKKNTALIAISFIVDCPEHIKESIRNHRGSPIYSLTTIPNKKICSFCGYEIDSDKCKHHLGESTFITSTKKNKIGTIKFVRLLSKALIELNK